VPPWLPQVLRRIRELAASGRVGFTDKASWEAQRLGLSRDDVVQILGTLTAGDGPTRLRSDARHERLYCFRPTLAGLRLYLKVAIRTSCVVISCHEDQAEAPEEADRDR
jgi:hypothetical protein